MFLANATEAPGHSPHFTTSLAIRPKPINRLPSSRTPGQGSVEDGFGEYLRLRITDSARLSAPNCRRRRFRSLVDRCGLCGRVRCATGEMRPDPAVPKETGSLVSGLWDPSVWPVTSGKVDPLRTGPQRHTPYALPPACVRMRGIRNGNVRANWTCDGMLGAGEG
jgi:hypothetical protein